MKLKLIYIVTFIFLQQNLCKSQVLITSRSDTNYLPDISSILEVRSNKMGVLLPQVGLQNTTDSISVNSPVNGVLVFNTSAQKLNFWQSHKWTKNLEVEDVINVIKFTKSYSGQSNASTTISSFPSTMPLFSLNSSTTGWTFLGSSTTIIVTKAVNSDFINIEGMTQVANSQLNDQFQYAIGIFVDGNLKIVRKYFVDSKTYNNCMYSKFNFTGLFDNLSVGNHTVAVYAQNLPRPTTGYSSITYGGNTSSCNNINNDMGRIFINAQITQ